MRFVYRFFTKVSNLADRLIPVPSSLNGPDFVSFCDFSIK